MARTRTLVSIVFVFGFLIAMQGVASSAVIGQVFPISSFSGTVDSVDIYVNGHGTMPTGPITFGLNPNTDNFMQLVGDDIGGQMSLAFGIAVDVPLFDQLGLGGDTVYITETGPYARFGNDIFGQTGGGGVSDTFQADVEICNQCNVWHIILALGQGQGEWQVATGGLEITIPASPLFDPNNPQTLITQGSGVFSTAPEPTTLCLVGPALVGLLARRKWFNAGSPR
jgi:hypothetical protein